MLVCDMKRICLISSYRGKKIIAHSSDFISLMSHTVDILSFSMSTCIGLAKIVFHTYPVEKIASTIFILK